MISKIGIIENIADQISQCRYRLHNSESLEKPSALDRVTSLLCWCQILGCPSIACAQMIGFLGGDVQICDIKGDAEDLALWM